MLIPVVRTAWGGRPAGVDRVATAMRATLAALPMPETPGDEGWFELFSRSAAPDGHEAWVDLVEAHRQRDPEGAIEPLTGFSLTLSRGDKRGTDEAAPWVEVRATVGAASAGPRIAANRVDVSASSGWFAAVRPEERVDVLRALVEAWAPSWAVVVDEPLMLGKPRLPARSPWPGYASYFADAIVPEPVLSDAFRVSRFADGTFAVLDEPWDATRVIEEIPRFLEASTYERIPQREEEEDSSASTR